MIITLCGSAKFESAFHSWNEKLTLAGHVVISLAVFPSSKGGDKDWYTPEIKQKLDLIHLAKIDASWAVVILNENGYVGESTSREEQWAVLKGKLLYSIEPRTGCRPAKELLGLPSNLTGPY